MTKFSVLEKYLYEPEYQKQYREFMLGSAQHSIETWRETMTL